MAPPTDFNEKGVVWALVCSIGDVCADVRVAAQSSLCALGAKQPTPVLRALLHTCMQQPSPAPGVLATLMSISQKVMVECVTPSALIKQNSRDSSDSVFEDNSPATVKDNMNYKTPLESQILDDWLQEAIHQLTRTSATNTVRVAADNLLVTIASKHNYFNEVCDALLTVLEAGDVNGAGWQSAAETISNVCSNRPAMAVSKLPQMMRVMQLGVDGATSDQVKSVVAATIAKVAQTVAEAVAERKSVDRNGPSLNDIPDAPRAPHDDDEADPATEEHDVQGEEEYPEDSEPLTEPLTAEVDQLIEDSEDLPRTAGEGLDGEMTLEEELKQAAICQDKLHLPDSPPSSRQDKRRDSAGDSDLTPEDGVTVDLNEDDLPKDPSSPSKEKRASLEQVPVTLGSYNAECDAIADILVSQWLKTHNADLRNETIAAIGHICPLLGREKLESLTPTIVSTILSLYRKISLPYNLTCTLAQLLAALIKQEAQEVLKPQLDAMIAAVLNQASVLPCYSEPNSVSNYSEALRCSHSLTVAYPAQMGTQLLSRLENVSYIQRVAALVVIRHLIGCKVLSDDIISGTVRLLTPILSDSNTRVIRAVAQLILQLCYHEHLDQTTAPTLIAYLVKHGAGAGTNLLCNGNMHNTNHLSNSSMCLGAMEEETVGDTCSRALYLLTTTVPCSHPLLWPRLLLFVTNTDYESSLPTVLPCLTHLVEMPHHSPDCLPLLPLLPSLPQCITPQQIITRLLGLCADPTSPLFLGGNALAVIGGIGGHISPNLQRRQWKEQVDQLKRTCISLAATEHDEGALQIWQDTVREFLSQTLTSINEEPFNSGLVSAMISEVTNDSDAERKMFLLSCLGVGLRHCRDPRLITDTLNSAFRITNHRHTEEQKSLAICVGSCGAGHIELVLGLLATWLKDADPKKMMSFMAMLKADSGEGSACIRGSVVMCLGQLCSLAPREQLLKHVDGAIMLHLLNVINTNKHSGVSSAVVDTISSICRSLASVGKDYSLPQRPLLLTHLVHCCDGASSAELPQLLSALRDLIVLEPILEVEERTILLQAALNATHTLLVTPPAPTTASGMSQLQSSSSGFHRHSITSNRGLQSSTLKSLASAGSAFSTPRHSITSLASLPSLPGLGGKSKTSDSFKSTSSASTTAVAGGGSETAASATGRSGGSVGAPIEADALAGDAGKTFAQLNLLLRTVIQRDPTPAPLDDITTLLQGWLLHSHTTIRSAAITLLLHTLHTYHTHLHFPPQVAVNFHQTSQLVGALIPRLGDSCGGVRCGGVGCVVAVLRVAARYNAHQPPQIEEALQPLTDVQKEISGSNGQHHESLLRTVAQVLCRELSGVQLRGLVFSTAGGLQDQQPGGRLAVAVVMAEMLCQRGHTLHYCGKQLLDHVYGRLEKVTDPYTRAIVVGGLTHLASPHLPLLADTLLSYPIPPHKGVCETWQSIGTSPKLVCGALTHLQQVVERTHAYTPQRTPTGYTVKVAAIQPLVALLSLTQLLHKLQVPVPPSDDHKAETPAAETPDCASSASTEVLDSVHPHAEAREAVINLLPSLLATLLPRYGCYVGVLPPLHHNPTTPTDTKAMSSFVPNPGATNIVPARAVLECLGVVWGVLGATALKDCLLQEARDVTHTHTLDTLTHALTNMATLVITAAPQQVSPLVTSLSGPHAERGERAAIAAFYSQLVYEACGGLTEVLSTVTSMLLGLVQDVCPDVRRLALRGLAHYAHLHHTKCYFPPWFGVDDRLHEIVGALVGGTDQREETMSSIDAEETEASLDRTSNATHISSGSGGGPSDPPLGCEERVCVEALRGLAALLPHLPAETVLPHTPLLLIRARLFAEKSAGEMREASFGVVRGLCSVVGETQEFKEQIPQHLLAAIIHLADKHQPTVVMCKSALLSLSHYIDSEPLQALLQSKLSPASSLDYKPFLSELAPLLVNYLGEHLSLVMAAACSYYHSRQGELRAAAAYFTGEVVRWGGGEGATGVATGLVLLMKDDQPSVRTAAASAAPLLSQHGHVL